MESTNGTTKNGINTTVTSCSEFLREKKCLKIEYNYLIYFIFFSFSFFSFFFKMFKIVLGVGVGVVVAVTAYKLLKKRDQKKDFVEEIKEHKIFFYEIPEDEIFELPVPKLDSIIEEDEQEDEQEVQAEQQDQEIEEKGTCQVEAESDEIRLILSFHQVKFFKSFKKIRIVKLKVETIYEEEDDEFDELLEACDAFNWENEWIQDQVIFKDFWYCN